MSVVNGEQYLEFVKSRRTYYYLSDKEVIPKDKVIEVVTEAIQQAPSAFNSQTSRVIILFGAAHKRYWQEIIANALPEDRKEAFTPRIAGFAAAAGTVLFFEDTSSLEQYQAGAPAPYQHLFPQWGDHSSGIAQVTTWTALEAFGFGVNLQHFAVQHLQGNVTKAVGAPDHWKPVAELVFGHPEQPPKPKTFIDSSTRVKVIDV